MHIQHARARLTISMDMSGISVKAPPVWGKKLRGVGGGGVGGWAEVLNSESNGKIH